MVSTHSFHCVDYDGDYGGLSYRKGDILYTDSVERICEARDMNGRVGRTCGLILCQKYHRMTTCNLHVSHKSRSVGYTIVLNWTTDILVQALLSRQLGYDHRSFDIVIPPPTAQRVLDIEDRNACTWFFFQCEAHRDAVTTSDIEHLQQERQLHLNLNSSHRPHEYCQNADGFDFRNSS